jgi:uncharacterized protein (TIGR04141 family)
MKGQQITLELLNTRRVFCADENHKRLRKSWSIYKCIYAEVDFEGQTYILNGGNWFRVNPDFVEKTNETFKDIPSCLLELPRYKGGGEGVYNESVSTAHAERYALLDKDTIYHGGGHGQVEVCDLFSLDRELIHVKLYGESHVLSHLFAQGFVSGELIQLDSEFRQKMKDKLDAPFADLVNVASRPGDKEYTIVYAVVSESPKPLHLPFFSRVNLNNTAKILTGYGYKVELLKIDWDDYAKAKKDPPEKKKKLI